MLGRCLGVLLCALWLIGDARPAGGLAIVVESVSALPFSSNYFDVFVKIEPGDVGLPQIGGFQVAVDLVNPPGAVLFQAPFAIPTTPGGRPQLIAENFTADFASDNGPNRASAFAFLNAGGTDFFDGAGLMRVPFDVIGGSVGEVVELDLSPFGGTVLSTPAAEAIPFTAISGTITIVPEPGTAPILALGLALLGWVRAGHVCPAHPGGKRSGKPMSCARGVLGLAPKV